MKLDISEMKPFKISELFEVELSKGDIKLDDMDAGDIPLVSSGETNNGIVGHIDKNGDGKAEIFPANRLTVDMFCNAFYQDTPFYAVSHGRVNILNPKFEMTKNTGLFIATAIKQEQYKYSYGRAVYSNVAADMDIKLPADDEGNPDWKFMEDYIKSLHHEPMTTKNRPGQATKISVSEWKEYRVGDIFDCDTTILSVKDDLADGSVPFISRTAENNGVDGHVDIEPNKVTKGKCITIGAEGIYAFYQDDDFATGNKVYQLRNDKMNKYSALFICSVLNKEDFRYSYGRARILGKLIEERIKLPADNDGNPHWQFMEDYIQSLPYGDRLEG